MLEYNVHDAKHLPHCLARLLLSQYSLNECRSEAEALLPIL